MKTLKLLCVLFANAALLDAATTVPPPVYKAPSGRILPPDPVTNHVTRTVYHYTNAPAAATVVTNTYTYRRQTNWVVTHPPIPLASAPGAQMSQQQSVPPDPSGNITLVQADPTLIYTQPAGAPVYENDQTGGATAPYYAYSYPEYHHHPVHHAQPSTTAVVVSKFFNLGRPVTRGGYFEIRGQRTTVLGFEGDWRSGADPVYGFGRYDYDHYTVSGGSYDYYGGSAPRYNYSGFDRGSRGTAPGYQPTGSSPAGGGTAPHY